MDESQFHEENNRLIELNDLASGWNCDYPPLATQFNYFCKKDDDDEEYSKFLFGVSGVTCRMEGDLDGFIDTLKKLLLENGLKI